MNSYKDIHCPHYIPCSGCSLDENVNAPPILEEIKKYFKELGTPFKYDSDKVIGWRDRAKLAIRGQSENPLIGLFEIGTHRVIDIPLCRVHHPMINQAAEEIKAWVKAKKIPLYNEINHKGLLRYLQCVVERSTGKVQLTLVINDSNKERVHSQLKNLRDAAPHLWHSIWLNLNTQKTNTIFGKEWHLIWGEEYVWDVLADTKVCFHPANFAQANLTVFEHLLKDVKAQIPAQKRIAEYYAGVGVIGRCLAEKSEHISFCEINPFAKPSFERANQEQPCSNTAFYTGGAEDHLSLLNEADIVIVDPPRKGLDRPLLQAIIESNHLDDLWYISCGWSSFKRDCQELLKNWRIVSSWGYLFFPGTDHVEIMAHFKRLN